MVRRVSVHPIMCTLSMCLPAARWNCSGLVGCCSSPGPVVVVDVIARRVGSFSSFSQASCFKLDGYTLCMLGSVTSVWFADPRGSLKQLALGRGVLSGSRLTRAFLSLVLQFVREECRVLVCVIWAGWTSM